MFQAVGAFDAKSQLSVLLRAVREGRCYTITVRGEPVADLIPSGMAASHDASAAVAAMRSFNKIRGVGSRDIGDWIAEGRR